LDGKHGRTGPVFGGQHGSEATADRSGSEGEGGVVGGAGDRTTSQVVSTFGVHATQLGPWKKLLVKGAIELFSDDRHREVQDQAALVAELYEQIGRLQMELGWLKKSCATRLSSSGSASRGSIRS
jgi:putative transposase